MDKEQKISGIRDRARKNFSRGFNCAECVVEAVLENIDTGLPKETLRLATGLGGGVGLFGDTCGAITGAVLAVGAVHGRSKLPDGDDPKAIAKKAAAQLYGKPGLYRVFNQLPNRVKEKYGSTLCREICSRWKDTWLCRDHALHCREIITDIAEFAATIICNDLDKTASQPFGTNVENLKDPPTECTAKS
jgi:C_GCAxxG_C_C family probable redox protein